MADGSFYPIMTEDGQKRKALEVMTVQDNQTEVHIDLYRSETDSMDDAEYVDSLEISDLNPHQNGEVVLSLDLSLDENNKLKAEVTDRETGNSSSSNVTLVSRTEEERSEPSNFSVPDFEDELPDTDALLEDFTFETETEAAEEIPSEEEPEEVSVSDEELMAGLDSAETDEDLSDGLSENYDEINEQPEVMKNSQIVSADNLLADEPFDSGEAVEAGEKIIDKDGTSFSFEDMGIDEDAEPEDPFVDSGTYGTDDSAAGPETDFPVVPGEEEAEPLMEEPLDVDELGDDTIVDRDGTAFTFEDTSLTEPAEEETSSDETIADADEIMEEAEENEADVPVSSDSSDIDLPVFSMEDVPAEEETVIEAAEISDPFAEAQTSAVPEFDFPDFSDSHETVVEEETASEEPDMDFADTDIMEENSFFDDTSVSGRDFDALPDFDTISAEEESDKFDADFDDGTTLSEVDGSSVTESVMDDIPDFDSNGSFGNDTDNLPDFDDPFNSLSTGTGNTDFVVPDFDGDSPVSSFRSSSSFDFDDADSVFDSAIAAGSAAKDFRADPKADMFAGLYDNPAEADKEEEKSTPTRGPVIVCSLCAIICMIVAGLVFFILPSRLNLLNNREDEVQIAQAPAAEKKEASKPADSAATNNGEADKVRNDVTVVSSDALNNAVEIDTLSKANEAAIKEASKNVDKLIETSSKNLSSDISAATNAAAAEAAARTLEEAQKEAKRIIEEAQKEARRIIEAQENAIVIATTPGAIIPQPPVKTAASSAPTKYKIAPGDTLWDIANAYYKNPWRYLEIATYNGISNPNYIVTGQEILIPWE